MRPEKRMLPGGKRAARIHGPAETLVCGFTSLLSCSLLPSGLAAEVRGKQGACAFFCICMFAQCSLRKRPSKVMSVSRAERATGQGGQWTSSRGFVNSSVGVSRESPVEDPLIPQWGRLRESRLTDRRVCPHLVNVCSSGNNLPPSPPREQALLPEQRSQAAETTKSAGRRCGREADR